VTMIAVRAPRRWRARLAAATLAVGLATTGAALTAPAVATTAAPTKAQPPKVAPIGKYAVGMISETFVDRSRPTDANGDSVPAQPARTLLTAIYYPTSGAPTDKPAENAPANSKNGPYPLLLFSHGLGARGVFYEDVIKTWVSAGYVVAAPDYPLSNNKTPGGVNFGRAIGDTKNQPADATFVIDEVIKLDKQGKRLGGIDAKRIGAAGHSLGGITTYGVAYGSCCRDKRLKAAIPMSGMGGVVEPLEQSFVNGQTPLLALHGNRDGTVPYQADVNTFNRAQPPKFFVTFVGAGHIEPFLGGTDTKAMALKQSTVDFLDHYLKNDKTALDKLRSHANVPGETSLIEHPAATGTRSPTTAKRGSSGG
jgi:predicted dienelactone hydrolase